MFVALGQSKLLDRIALEVELNHYRRFATLDPRIVSWCNLDHLRRNQLYHTTIGVFHVKTSAGQETGMTVHAKFGPSHGLHVCGPAETGRIDHALNPAIPGCTDVELNSADFAMVGSRDRCYERFRHLQPF